MFYERPPFKNILDFQSGYGSGLVLLKIESKIVRNVRYKVNEKINDQK